MSRNEFKFAEWVHSPHDKLIKALFRYKEIAIRFFKHFLPPGIMAGLDWSSLRIESNSYIDDGLKERFSDLLFSVRFKNKRLYLYLLLEHRSVPYRFMPRILLRYMVEIWDECAKNQRGKLPPILPVVLHQGPAPWKFSKKFVDCLHLLPEHRSELIRRQPDFEHILVDLSRISFDEIAELGPWAVGLMLMKAAREKRLEEWLEHSERFLADWLTKPSKNGLVNALLKYLLSCAGSPDLKAVRDLTEKIKNRKVRKSVMTLAERLLKEGIQQGRQQGRRQGIQMGRKQGLKMGREQGIQEGWLIGRIQMCQSLLGQRVVPDSKLEQKTPSELKKLLRQLETALHRQTNRRSSLNPLNPCRPGRKR